MPHVSIEIGSYRQAVAKSKYWSSSDERLQEAYRHILRAGAATILAFFTVIALVATAVALLTKGLDPRMEDIINGISYYMASAIFLFISRKVPKWTWVYYHTTSMRQHMGDDDYLGTSPKVLKFKVFCDIGIQFFRIFFLLLPFYCGANAAVIPVSVALGIILGFFIDFCVWGCRHARGQRRLIIAVVSTILLFLSGLALFLTGTYYIADVWGLETKTGRVVTGVVMAVLYSFVAAVIHGVMWYRTKQQRKEQGREAMLKQSRENARSRRERMGTSLLVSKIMKHSRHDTADVSNDYDGKVSFASPLGAIGEEDENGEKANDSDTTFDEGEGNANDSDRKVACPSKKCSTDTEEPFFMESDRGSGQEKETSPIENQSNEDAHVDDETSPMALFCAMMKCSKMTDSKEESEKKSLTDKILCILNVTLWVLVSMGFLFFVAVNIGCVFFVDAQVHVTFFYIFYDPHIYFLSQLFH